MPVRKQDTQREIPTHQETQQEEPPLSITGLRFRDRPQQTPINELIEDLDSDQYQVREEATAELIEREDALDSLLEIIAHPKTSSTEASYRAQTILSTKMETIVNEQFSNSLIGPLTGSSLKANAFFTNPQERFAIITNEAMQDAYRNADSTSLRSIFNAITNLHSEPSVETDSLSSNASASMRNFELCAQAVKLLNSIATETANNPSPESQEELSDRRAVVMQLLKQCDQFTQFEFSTQSPQIVADSFDTLLEASNTGDRFQLGYCFTVLDSAFLLNLAGIDVSQGVGEDLIEAAADEYIRIGGLGRNSLDRPISSSILTIRSLAKRGTSFDSDELQLAIGNLLSAESQEDRHAALEQIRNLDPKFSAIDGAAGKRGLEVLGRAPRRK